MKIEILRKNEKYPTCIETERVLTKDDYNYAIECQVVKNDYTTNYRPQVIRKVFCCSNNSYSDCLEVFFKQQEQWRYCNNLNIRFVFDEDKKNYSEYFYGADGIGNYAKCGGKMD
jgi:hypothetical protein